VTDTKPGMEGHNRHVYGPRPVAVLLPRLTRAAFRRHSPGSAQLIADWAAVVGPALAQVTMPRRVAAGTLTLACSGPVAIELQHYGPELMTRINAYLGTEAVRQLRFVQTGTAAAASAPPSAPKPSAAAMKRVERAVADLPPGPLRDALAALGRSVVAAPSRSTTTRTST
jgi:hypothetical protein